ncbi:serine protease inhibitor dipetalogastin-like [Planococcus citri]|uniref:serine protease inhibitor dipetalogastin-like n=1 Tax=Planococcus citri TaxID=170843 RepID=UPI0031F9BDA5
MFLNVKVLGAMAVVFLVGDAIGSESGNPVFDNPCMKVCPTTKEYIPFCGSDNYTYGTSSILNCFKKCNVSVTKAYDGPCEQELENVEENENEEDDEENIEGYNEDVTTAGADKASESDRRSPLEEHPCVKMCSKMKDVRPFCGSDNYTYVNRSYLGCFKKCNIPVTMAYDGPCKRIPIQ